MRSILTAALLLFVLPVHAQTQEQQPIIDMHLHANAIGDHPMEEPMTGFMSPESTEELRKQTLEALREHNVVLAATSADPVTDSYKQAAPERIMKGCIVPPDPTGRQLVMTPSFFGTEPAVIDTGRYAGTEVLQKEQDRGLQFMQSLNGKQQKRAQIGKDKTKEELLSAPFQDNLKVEYAGISAGELDAALQDSLLNLVRLYVTNMREGHARVRMEQVQEHLGETYFGWHGKVSSDAVYYYRIHSPVIFIEFDHAIPRGLPDVKKEIPYRDHIHTVIRTPNGNDYGKSLLKQNYEKHEDNPGHRHHR